MIDLLMYHSNIFLKNNFSFNLLSQKFYMKLAVNCVFLLFVLSSMAQPVDTANNEVIDFSKFTDAVAVKRYCTPKITGQTPQRFVSIGYEYQGAFTMPNMPNNFALGTTSFDISSITSFRLNANIPVISKDNIVWQMGANVNLSQINSNKTVNTLEYNGLINRSMNSIGLNTTIFKPLNEKHFIIFQANVDANEFNTSITNFNNKSLTASASLIYGTKKNDDEMIGYGVSRSYRAGRLMYFPVLLWNKSFNKKWGMELLLPARGHVRYQPNQNNIYQLGFELEGNQYYANINNRNVFIQRGELKPRLMLDKKLTTFFWLNVQAGLRYNWRFEGMTKYFGKDDADRIFKSNLTNPLFFNISLNFVSP